MKRISIVLLFLLISLIPVSCNKTGYIFSNGEPITQDRCLNEPFSAVRMYDNVNVELIRSSDPHIELTCPRNLIDRITTSVEGNALIIKNENKYNWLRSFDYECNMKVFYDSIKEIEFASIGHLTAKDSLRGIIVFDTLKDTSGNDSVIIKNRTLFLEITEGSGDIDLTINCNILQTQLSNGTSKITLKGEAGYAEHLLRSYGRLDAKELNSNIITIQSNTTNDAYIWARTRLTVEIGSIGNVYYKGDPDTIKIIHGDGQVLPIE